MTSIEYWIQHADFSAEDYRPVGVTAAIAAFHDHDWAAALEKRALLEAPETDWCPPGFGLVDGKRILHICPDDELTAMVHYQWPKRRRFLGLFAWEAITHVTKDQFPLAHVDELIQRFYTEDHDWILPQLR